MGLEPHYCPGDSLNLASPAVTTFQSPTHPARQDGGIRRHALATLALLAVLGAPAAVRADCGDDIRGERVACQCGDIVASSTRLLPGDPVASAPCISDGLIVRAPVSGEPLVLDLNGQELRGSGSGAGVLVLPGGSAGVEIRGGTADMRAVVSGFRNGIRAMADGSLARAVNVTVRDSVATGVAVRGSATKLEGIRIEGSGDDGLRASGRSVAIDGVEVSGSARRGVVNRARDAGQSNSGSRSE